MKAIQFKQILIKEVKDLYNENYKILMNEIEEGTKHGKTSPITTFLYCSLSLFQKH
jgi:hypothetical protein